MNLIAIEDILKTFRIIVDTREHDTHRAEERYSSFSTPIVRATLAYGDYCGQVDLPNGSQAPDASETICAPCVIERKMSLDELAMCFTRGRDRFRREFERARDSGAKVYLLIENGSWEAIAGHRYRSKFNPEAFRASLIAWTIRYNVTPIFCKEKMSGMIIREILYRDMKERLEKECESSGE